MNGQKPQQQQPTNAQLAWIHLQNGNVVIRWRDPAEQSTIARVMAIEPHMVILQVVATGLIQIAHWQDIRTITQSALDLAREVPARPAVVQ